MSRELHVRWDRVGLLLAALTVSVVLLVNIAHRPTAHPTTSTAASSAPARGRCSVDNRALLRDAPPRGAAKTVALTFDDGPGPWTDGIVAVLARRKVPATFFVVGNLARRYPDRVRAAASAGHLIENHSWSHPLVSPERGWPPGAAATQIARASDAITLITGDRPCLFRPPGGVVKGARAASREAGMSIALWSVDTRDWAGQHGGAAKAIRARARAGLDQRHPVVLLHDGGGHRAATTRALDGIIDDYQERGYTFVTLEGGL